MVTLGGIWNMEMVTLARGMRRSGGNTGRGMKSGGGNSDYEVVMVTLFKKE